MEKGIKETKDLVGFIALLGNAIDKTTDNGLQMADFGEFMGALGRVPAALDGIDEVPAEIKDLDAAELSELKADLASQLDLRDDVLEGIIEESITIGAALFGLVQKIKAAREA